MDNRRQHADDTTNSHDRDAGKRKTRSLCRQISWGGIIAGTLVALVCMMALNLLGIGIGLGAVRYTEAANPFAGLSTGAIIWWIAGNIISIFSGGYVAGRIASIPFGFGSMLHGLLTWCLFTLISFWILTSSVGSLMSSTGSTISATLTTNYTLTEATAMLNNRDSLQQGGRINMREVKREIRQILYDNENASAQTAEAAEPAEPESDRQNMGNMEYVPEVEIDDIAQDIFYQDNELVEEIDRQHLTNIIQDRTGLSTSESMDIAGVMIRKYRQTKREAAEQEKDLRRQAEEISQKAAKTASTAAIWTFAAIILGAVSASIGGQTARPDRPVDH